MYKRQSQHQAQNLYKVVGRQHIPTPVKNQTLVFQPITWYSLYSMSYSCPTDYCSRFFWDNLLSWGHVLNLWDIISVVWTFNTQCVRTFTVFIQHHCSPCITIRWESKMKMSLLLIYHFTLNKNNATTIVHIHQNYISIIISWPYTSLVH
jgi:hypothetical protein